MAEESESVAELFGSESTTSDDLACQVCGVPLTYSGRGRKPKFCDDHRQSKSSKSSSSPRSSADVNAALQVMETSYTALSIGLHLFSPVAAEQWDSSHDNLIETDRQAFIADKKLCQRVVKFGQTSGTGMFIGAHIFALAPVVMALRTDMQNRRDERRRVSTPDATVMSNPDAQEATEPFPNAAYFGAA